MSQPRSLVREVLAWSVYPLMLVGSLMTCAALMTQGYGKTTAVFAVTFFAAFPLLLLQLRMPAAHDWKGRPADFGLDLLHMMSTAITGDLWRAVSFGAAFAVSAWLAARLGFALWPTEWPLLAQLALAMVVGDFGAYWVHRICHTVPLFWRVHAMHHTSERLYVFSASRNHPANVVLAWGSQALPLVVMGASGEVLALMSVFTAVHGMLQHANIELKHGWLNHVFATADLHRWHHSTVLEESNTNFGSNLILWDWVFGTRMLPEDRTRPEKMGIDGYELPDNWFVHLASPFVLERYATDEVLADFDAVEDFTLENRPVDAALEHPGSVGLR